MSNISRKIVISLLGILTLFGIVRFAVNKSQEDKVTSCKAEYERTVSGVIESYYMDNSINVKAFTIIFSNGKKFINPVFFLSLNGVVAVGDSIYKESGSYKFLIFKKGNINPFVVESNLSCP